ncbi:hypothetical protein A9Q93_07185 [Nonlabens dokdonensis]|uniref:Uncharacterized protein n=1 Tax=Nonlabens dokdonensis TaxID=328515 RepID=A0A1Z8AXB7_9FLAO|nr:hypothetical protein [Nonlabens dokdonensis]OUS14974.1 hypothetical protein A9Q93_07185 [Nonlabens dokdonensis]
MFKKLEKLLGKPMKYYENLMSSRKEIAQITAAQKQLILEQLEPLTLDAYRFNSLPVVAEEYISNFIEVPKNKKEQALPCKGVFERNDQLAFLFIDDEKAIKNASNYQLILKKQLSENRLKNIKTQEGTLVQSLPIWEEIIHRFPKVHKLVVATHEEHPWTLYKETAKEIEQTSSYKMMLGGYPKWHFHQLDFRKLKPLEFILEYRIEEKDFSIYFFKDPETNEVVSFEQKD